MRVPKATYRLQFGPGFGFREARQVIPYLAELGVSEVYASPVFEARPGSGHGYDVIDPNELNPELGTRADFEALGRAVSQAGLGWIQDIVPNHMAFDGGNLRLMDVLELGQASPWASFFDIDWDHPGRGLRGRLLAPFLGRPFRDCLAAGEIRLVFEEQGFRVRYFDLVLPLRPESWAELLSPGPPDLAAGRPALAELEEILAGLGSLGSLEDPATLRERAAGLKSRLVRLCERDPAVRNWFDRRLERINTGQDQSGGRDELERILSTQHYRLAFWRRAGREINYRRFFDVNELICLRQEGQEVFEETHRLLAELIAAGWVTGLRVDHVDGLLDPAGYLNRLRGLAQDCWLAVEKILDPAETLPADWPVQGTTGYDFLNQLSQVFCQRDSEAAFDRVYAGFTGCGWDLAELVSGSKKLIIATAMAGEADNLTRLFLEALARHWPERGSSPDRLGPALVELAAAWPVYRTYVGPGGPSAQDRAYVNRAGQGARRRPDLAPEIETLEQILLLEAPGRPEAWLEAGLRFQQFTGPLMAKGFEDTTLYVYNRLLALNVVGGDPGQFGSSLAEFHRFNQERLAAWPHSLSATATHDAKRGEDSRARLGLLSEMPQEWGQRLVKWAGLNQGLKRTVRGKLAPDANEEYFIYQTLLGAWSFEVHDSLTGRIQDYLVKALREAKVNSSWQEPDLDYEAACLEFVRGLLTDPPGNSFLEDFKTFQSKISYNGIFNSLSQTLLKIVCPGVPDFYQGTELWDLSLVDPDNRRPVDFEVRRELLAQMKARAEKDPAGLLAELLAAKQDGRIKLWLIHRALQARRLRPDLFSRGAYRPIRVEGGLAGHVIALARSGRDWAVAAAPRFLTGLLEPGADPCGSGVWGETRLCLPEDAPGDWRDVITGRRLRTRGRLLLGEALESFPVCLLLSEEGS